MKPYKVTVFLTYEVEAKNEKEAIKATKDSMEWEDGLDTFTLAWKFKVEEKK
ncbi:hypothetical protein ES703_08229 [subsurface metagenome]